MGLDVPSSVGVAGNLICFCAFVKCSFSGYESGQLGTVEMEDGGGHTCGSDFHCDHPGGLLTGFDF